MLRKTSLLLLLTTLSAGLALAADVPRFRGPNGDGVFAESGLLASWPESGPKMLWSLDGLGESYSTVSVADGRIYTTGMTDKQGSVYAIDPSGELLWKKDYGAEHDGKGYPGTRNTPTVAGGHLYLLSSLGKAMAVDAASGEARWEVDLFDRFQGKNTYFGLAESPLVLGERVIYTPGGPDASVVALDAKSGATVWTSKGLSDGPGYCTPRLFDDGQRRQLVTLVAKSLVGLEPDTGALLWKQPMNVEYDIHAVSPEFAGDGIYVSHGYKQGGKFYRLAADGGSVTEAWTEKKLDVHHGGAIVLDGHIYGAASNGTWYALDADTGEIAAEIKRLGKGSMALADGRLYGYTEDGKVVLVDPDPANFKVISSFEIDQGSGHHWSHPVVSDGVLYVRHGSVLMAFDVSAAG